MLGRRNLRVIRGCDCFASLLLGRAKTTHKQPQSNFNCILSPGAATPALPKKSPSLPLEAEQEQESETSPEENAAPPGHKERRKEKHQSQEAGE